ncbi:bone morphogenetic protein 2-like [Mizuhopecten yessoensis]|uniref:Bone morphogenetic protein 4 n=1 Tax=Mizuhopecten yessoensis TaxID=6573 RepID=A0A210PNT3_MIZYE|nr:bone morphogenetic protein 2-like [Mizuhopecten yessoensis]OWF38128.1 Bone morphogenetic protein 4 [Mizuhopecten yessoensis]
MASLRELFMNVYLVVIIVDNGVRCNPISSEHQSNEQDFIRQSLGTDESASSNLNRQLTQYELDMYEIMRRQDSDLTRRTTDESFQHQPAREAIHFLRPQFGNFGRRLYFNLSSIPTNVNITHAEVVFTSPNSATQISGITIPDHDPTSVVLHGSSTTSGYKIDVSEILQTETISHQPNMEVNVQLRHQTDFRLRSHDRRVQRLEPMLSVFENIDTEPFLRTNNPTRARRSSESTNAHTSTESETCHLQPWTLDFSEIGLNSVRYPTTYEANICVGNCNRPFSSSLMNSTHYAYLKNLYHFVTNYTMTDSVPSACCTPATYGPLSVIYLEKRNDLYVIERIENMRVTSCGCR